MPFSIPTTPVPSGHDPHDVGRLRDGETCHMCEKEAEYLRYGVPKCREHK